MWVPWGRPLFTYGYGLSPWGKERGNEVIRAEPPPASLQILAGGWSKISALCVLLVDQEAGVFPFQRVGPRAVMFLNLLPGQ